ncbi:hypothetical protein CSC2_06540 [Clostridium zeae]|uniref:Uncharacterized protein n=1 Tax=Clostridium zeae TaxID=2759022 RepID=A0ABQ1E5V9_9CLOT|nr:hypothetical protein [Clostridium zeae]GFZ30128.1 hypothetical protein CSC2_06540 [Clostridium zeae]
MKHKVRSIFEGSLLAVIIVAVIWAIFSISFIVLSYLSMRSYYKTLTAKNFMKEIKASNSNIVTAKIYSQNASFCFDYNLKAPPKDVSDLHSIFEKSYDFLMNDPKLKETVLIHGTRTSIQFRYKDDVYSYNSDEFSDHTIESSPDFLYIYHTWTVEKNGKLIETIIKP